MAKITEELIRKRAEHNEGVISTLEEISLHQENIIKIENIDKWCKNLKIILLQSNLISKIENLGRLNQLEYLNLAMNNIELIENLEKCEMLKKLDLTLNFIGDLGSVKNLIKNEHLETLFLTGNPCSSYNGYRDFVIATLPQLKYFDGKEILRSERIIAQQNLGEISEKIPSYNSQYQAKRTQQKEATKLEITAENVDRKDPEENFKFWKQTSENTPETRMEIAQQTRRAQKALEQENEAEVQKRKINFFKNDGTPYNINEPKIPFRFNEDEETNSIILTVETYKYMDTSLIDIDIQPKYVRLKIKGKILQLTLAEEVKMDSAVAQRSQATGHLTITMPKMNGEIKLKEKNPENKKIKAKTINDSFPLSSRRELLEIGSSVIVDYSNIIKNNDRKRREEKIIKTKNFPTNSGLVERTEEFVDDPDVPPLE